MNTLNNLSLWTLAFLAMVTLLTGCGNKNPTFSLMPEGDVFRQTGGIFNNQLDILFVIDSSGSMIEEQQNMANNFASFITQFQTKGYDFKIAVTATDAYLANPLLNGYNPANVVVGKFRDRAFRTSTGVYQVITSDSVCGSPPPFTNVFVITPATPNLATVFGINVMPCIRGTGDERAFSSFMTSLTSPLNSGFLRLQSFLAIIIVSDEDDISGWGRPHTTNPPINYGDPNLDPVSGYVTQLDNLTAYNGRFRRYSVSDISRLSPACPGPGTLQYPNRYTQLTTLTDGVSGSICDPSFADSLNAIQSKIAELSSQFFLDREPQVDTIVVRVNGALIPMSPTNGWTYIPLPTNAIMFHGPAVPPQGALINIDYIPVTVK